VKSVVFPFGERDDFFGYRSKLLGLLDRGDDFFMLEQRRELISKQCFSMSGRPTQFSS
jgi:hypothetical protein